MRQFPNPLFLIFLGLTTAFYTCVFSKDALPGRKFHSTIIPEKDKNHIPVSALAFRPNRSELKQAEAILEKVYRKEMLTQDFDGHIPLQNYTRQYFGYLDEKGDRIVFIQCFARDMANGYYWRQHIIYMDDGCNGIFRVKINLETDSYFDFHYNYCA